MAIDRIGSQQAGQLGTLLLGGVAAPVSKRSESERREENTSRSTEAITVELSPAARRGAAERAVTTANHEAAGSANWFASAEGTQALASLR